jgi:hypothetical protein
LAEDDSDLARKFFYADSAVNFVWERLNTGHWSEVDLVWRQLFMAASLVRISALMQLLPRDYGKPLKKTPTLYGLIQSRYSYVRSSLRR